MSHVHATQCGPSQEPDLGKGCGEGGARNALVEAADQQHVAAQVDEAGHRGRQQGRHGIHGRQKEGLRHEDQQRRRQAQAPAPGVTQPISQRCSTSPQFTSDTAHRDLQPPALMQTGRRTLKRPLGAVSSCRLRIKLTGTKAGRQAAVGG